MKIYLSFLIVLFFTFSIYSKSGKKVSQPDSSTVSKSDSVNIKQLVASQIEYARKEQLSEKSRTKDAALPATKSVNTVTGNIFFNNMPGSLNASYKIIMKISFFGFISLMAALLIYLRRRHLYKDASINRSFKDNIKLLREEKLFAKKNPKLSKLRKELGSSPATFNYSKERISKTAKEMNISKGEILLAAKIKAHEFNRQ